MFLPDNLWDLGTVSSLGAQLVVTSNISECFLLDNK